MLAPLLFPNATRVLAGDLKCTGGVAFACAAMRPERGVDLRIAKNRWCDDRAPLASLAAPPLAAFLSSVSVTIAHAYTLHHLPELSPSPTFTPFTTFLSSHHRPR